MAQATPLDIRFGKLNTKMDPALLPPGDLTLAENCSVQTDGIYRKRNGYTALAAVPSTPPVRLAARGKEALACHRSLLYSYRGPTVDGWRSIGRLPSAQTSQMTVALDQTQDVTVGSRATANGVTVHAYAAGTGKGLLIRCISATSGATVATASDNSFATVAFVRCIVVGNYVAIWWTMGGGAQQLRYMRVDTTTLAILAATTYRSGAEVNAATPYFDVFGVDSTTCLIAWYSATPNTRVVLFNMATQTTLAGPTAMSADVVDSGIAVASNGAAGTFGMVAYHSVAAGGLRGVVFNALTTAVTVAAFTIEAVTAPIAINCGLVYVPSVTRMLVMWDRAASGTTKQKTESAQVTSGGAITIAAAVVAYSCGLASKPVLDPTASDTFPVLVNVWCPHNLQQTYFTLRVSTAGSGIPKFTIAMHAYRNAFKTAAVAGQLTDADTYSSTAIAFSAPIAYKFLSTGTARAGWATFTADLGAATNLLPVQALSGSYFAAGYGANYDGSVIREMNFLLYPEIDAATPGAVGAAGMDNGTYSYIAIFESADALGNTDRSTTSIPVSATTSAGAGLGKVTLTIDHLQMTLLGFSGQGTGTISIFRTLAAGTTYFFVGSVAMDVTVAGGLASYVDQANDSTIAGNRLLYTTGGVLDREPPLASNQFAVHRNAIWGISSADPKNLFYSGDYSPGESPWFSSAFQLRADVGGSILAIASMDAGLVVFKEDLIFVVHGDRSNQTGQGGTLSLPQLISSDCGCVDPRSVIAIPQGLMFKSNKGIYLLTRGFEVQFIGAAVDQWTSTYSNVTSAVMIPDRREVRFEMADPIPPLSTPDGVTLVYNYEADRWTTHRKDAFTTASVSAIAVNGSYFFANATGGVYQESAGFIDPGNLYIQMTIETGWLKPTGDQGLCRVQYALWLGESKSAHALQLQIARNYVSSYTMAKVWSSATLAALAQEQVSMNLAQQKGESFRVRVNDQSDGGVGTPGEGMTARALRLMAIPQRGSFEKFMSATAKG